MVTLVDVADEVGNPDNVRKAVSEEIVSQGAEQSAQPEKKAEATSVEDKLPPKLRGKSLDEIAEMYVNLESSHGRMANDLGTQRKLTDRLLDLKRAEDLRANGVQEPKQQPVTADELLTRPDEALNRVIEARLAKQERESQTRLQQMEAALQQERFVAKHPDYLDIANDPQFVAWVQGSQYRIRAAQTAQNGSYEAADDLLVEWKSRRGSASAAPQKAEKAEKSDDLESARKVSLESSRSVGSETGATSTKVYRRADLLRLMVEDPEAYYADDFQAVVHKAHQEGRVR